MHSVRRMPKLTLTYAVRIQKGKRMGILSWILMGALAGWLASKITGNDASMGWIANIIVGIIGAVIGGFVMSLIGRTGVDGFNLPSFLVATGGAVLLLAVVKGFRKR